MKASPAAAFFVLMSRPAATSVMVARKFNECPCLVCGVPNSSSEQLRTHTLGKKHGRQGSGPENLEVLAAAVEGPREGRGGRKGGKKRGRQGIIY